MLDNLESHTDKMVGKMDLKQWRRISHYPMRLDDDSMNRKAGFRFRHDFGADRLRALYLLHM